MKRENWPVGDYGVRPAGPPDECFYCQVKVGEQHKADCVIRQRTVVVEATIRYVISVPEDWTPEHIEFHRNEGSWCSNNARNELTDLFQHKDKEDQFCLCGDVNYKYVGEATEADEAKNGVFVSEAKT